MAMDTGILSRRTGNALREQTGIVIPVYVPEGVNRDDAHALVRDTAELFSDLVTEPRSVCLSLDGAEFGLDLVQRIVKSLQVSHVVSEANRGKFHSAAQGVQSLLDRHAYEYIAIVDQDGDHFANELINFVRAAKHIASQTGTNQILVLGRRLSRHRPMGFLRGELEELADRILLDALAYRAAVTNRPLRMECAHAFDEFPDFHSGYKLFTRTTAQAVFLEPHRKAGVSDDCFYRHACEAVMTVEAFEHGAYLGVVNRSTLNEQPVSTFGLLQREQLVADKIIWPCKRLEVPLPFVEQWFANHAPRLLLHTMAPSGRQELMKVLSLIRKAYGCDDTDRPTPPLQPMFV